MVVNPNFRQKNYICNSLSRNALIVPKKILKLLWAFNALLATVLLFTVIQNKKQQKVKNINYKFFDTPENLKDIANRSDSIGSS